MGRRESRGKSQGASGQADRRQFSPARDEKGEDEVAIDQYQRRSRRKVSHQLKPNESSDLETAGVPGSVNEQNRSNMRAATQDALESGLAAEATANNQLYQKVSQRKQIVQRHIA